jgi:hypothetical protein
MLRTRLAAAAIGGLGLAALAAVPAHATAPAAAKVHYLSACHATGSCPNCDIFGQQVSDTASIHVHVWGSERRCTTTSTLSCRTTAA